MSLKREVARVEEMDSRIGNVAFESLGTCWQEKRIVFAPDCEERWFVFAEVFVERRIQRDIARESLLRLNTVRLAFLTKRRRVRVLPESK